MLNQQLTIEIKTYDPSAMVGQLIPDGNLQNIIYQLENQTVWIPYWPYPVKHGDIINVYGRNAINLHGMISQINTTGTTTVKVLYYGPGNAN